MKLRMMDAYPCVSKWREREREREREKERESRRDREKC